MIKRQISDLHNKYLSLTGKLLVFN